MVDKNCKHIKHQRLCHEAVVLNAATLYEGAFCAWSADWQILDAKAIQENA